MYQSSLNSYVVTVKFGTAKKIGAMWDNHHGLLPMQPFQPEFVVIFIRKYVNGIISASEAEIFSRNDEFYASDVERTKNWFQCNDDSDFMFGTIDEAYEICREMISTTKSYYSQV